LFNPSERTRADAEVLFRQIGATARLLGAKCYTFHGAPRIKKKQYIFNFEKLGGRFDQLDKMLSEYGACLAYENVHWTYFNEPQFYADLRAHTKVKCCLDIKQAMQSGVPWQDYLVAMAGRIINVHLSDYTAEGKLCVPGKGVVNFRELFLRLADTGYTGPALMELYSEDYADYDELYKSYEYLKNILEKENLLC
jgi:sugar phosphate isomerase/epimerase